MLLIQSYETMSAALQIGDFSENHIHTRSN